MKINALKIVKLSGEIAVAIILFLAIIVGLARAFFPYVDHYRPYVAQRVAAALHQPATIGKLVAEWRGIHPAFILNNVTIYDHSAQHPLLVVQKFSISVNLLASLWHRRIVPSEFHLSGAQLTIRTLDNQTVVINGITTQFAKGGTSSNNDIQDVLHWFAAQGQVSIEKVDIDWINKNGVTLPLTDVRLQINHGFFHQQVIGAGVLATNSPTPFRFVVKLSADAGGIAANGYFAARNLDVTPWLRNQQWHGFAVHSGKLPHVQVWVQWKERRLQSVQTLVTLNQAQIYRPPADNVVAVTLAGAMQGNLLWQREGLGWSLSGDQLGLEIDKQRWPLQQFGLHHLPASDGSNDDVLAVDRVDAAQINQLLRTVVQLPESQQRALQTLQPHGQLTTILLRRDTAAQSGNTQYFLDAGLDRFGVDAWNNIPGIDHIQGRVHITPTSGSAQLNSQDATLNWPQLFDTPLNVNQLQAALYWQKDPAAGWRVAVDQLHVVSPGLALNGAIRFYNYPAAQGGPFIRVLAGFSSPDVRYLHTVVPDSHLPVELSRWLKSAFLAGRLDGTLLLQGPLQHFPFKDHTGRFEVIAHTHALTFNYRDLWPPLQDLDATLRIDDGSLVVDVNQANFFAAPLHNLQARIPDLTHSVLSVSGAIDTNAGIAARYILSSPLQQTLGEMFHYITLTAPIALQLGLQVPMYHNASEPFEVTGDVRIAPGTLALGETGITLESFQGALRFTKDSVTADNLSGVWMGQPVAVNIATHKDKTGNEVLNVQANSTFSVATLAQTYHSAVLGQLLKGSSTFTAGVELKKVAGQTHPLFSLDSDLVGVSAELPPPWRKAANEAAPLHITAEFAHQGKALLITANYAKQLSTVVALQKDSAGKWVVNGANLRLGSGMAQAPTTPGLTIDGQLASLNTAELSSFLAPLLKSSGGGEAGFKLNRINLTVAQLNAFGMTLTQAGIQARPVGDGWAITIDSPTIAGQVTIPANVKRNGIQGTFQRFIITPQQTQTSTTNINPGDIPPLRLMFQNLAYGSHTFGRVTLVTVPVGNALQIETLTSELPGFNLSLTGRWQGGGAGTTALSGSFTSADMGNTLKTWQVTQSLAKAAGKGTFRLSWPGPAYSPDMSRIAGSFSFAFSSGQIINIGSGEAEMGIGRILNLLSLQNIPRSLTLDFSDWSTQGFPFDSLKGDFTIQNGNAFTRNTLLQGPLAKIEAKGRIGLGSKDYDLQMSITPYLTGSLPVAATLIGGPVVGAAAWVANKIVGPVVGQLTSHTYKVTGSWANPVIIKLSMILPVGNASTAKPQPTQPT